jgi:hypothetical protein
MLQLDLVESLLQSASPPRLLKLALLGSCGYAALIQMA